MKHWAQFYHKRDGRWVEAVGSFGIIRIDARLSRMNMHAIARVECRKRKYDGYQLMRGNRLESLFALTSQVLEP